MVIKTVGVIGLGTMGSGIIQICAEAGYQVKVLARKEESIKKGKGSIEKFLNRGIEKGKVTVEHKEAVLAKILWTLDKKDFADCDLIIDAAAEDMELKKKMFTEMEEIVGEHTIFGTNTSSLSIVEMAAATKRADKVIGIHFFNPAQIMKLVEIVKTIVVSEETVEITKNFVDSLGKTIIYAKDYPGFIVNYLQYPLRLHAIRMVEQGLATAEDIDKAAKLGLGHPMGPLELQDMVGLDITYNACSAIYEETKDPKFAPPILMKKMIAAGKLGRKTGEGFYKYEKK